MKTDIEIKFYDWILKEDHPCIMAQTVFSQDQVVTKDFGKLGTRDTAVAADGGTALPGEGQGGPVPDP